MKESKRPKQYTRRDMLKMSVLTGVGVAVSTSSIGVLANMANGLGTSSEKASSNSVDDSIISFNGKNQAGIVTPQQTYAYVAAFDLLTNQKDKVIDLFKKWTVLSQSMTQGEVSKDNNNDWLPPKDTGEAQD